MGGAPLAFLWSEKNGFRVSNSPIRMPKLLLFLETGIGRTLVFFSLILKDIAASLVTFGFSLVRIGDAARQTDHFNHRTGAPPGFVSCSRPGATQVFHNPNLMSALRLGEAQ